MSFVKQTLALTVAGVRSIPQRPGSSLVTVLGVTSVVGVLVSLLSMREGASSLDNKTAGTDSVVILGRGATSAAQSVLSRDTVTVIASAPELKRTPDGKPYLAATTMVSVDAIRRNGKRGSIYLMGLTSGGSLVQADTRIIEGRTYRPAVHELIVSDQVRKIFRGMEVGRSITLRGVKWTIVGVFAGGDALGDSVLRADAETVMSAFARNTFQEIDARLDSPRAYETFKAALLANPAIAVDVKTLAQRHNDTFGDLTRLLDFIAYFIGGVMASGAVCGALNSLYASVDARRGEIAALRAIGFGNVPLILSLLAEGVLLVLPGAIIGACLAWLLFNGHVVSTQGLVFTLTITPRVLLIGIAWAAVIGLLGGSMPALRAARMSVAAALRAS